MHNLAIEREHLRQGYSRVIGIDEVGRGSWAGPLVFAAFSINCPLDEYEVIVEADDSKKLIKNKREMIHQRLELQIKAGHVQIFLIKKSAKYISKYGLAKAIRQTMQEVRELFSEERISIIADGSIPRPTNLREDDSFVSIVKGDSKVYSIAAAANYAKVYRDKLMYKLAKKYPGYKFESNVGYGTKDHQLGIQQYGATNIHRLNYKSIARYTSR
jgi:ribonuclease HII